MKPKLYIYKDCHGFNQEFAFQRDLLFSFAGDASYEVVDNPIQADFFTVPFSIELISELIGEPQYCLNVINDLEFMKDPELRSKHFFITNAPDFPSARFPECRFFRTANLTNERALGANEYSISPFVQAKPSDNPPEVDWAIVSRFGSKLRTRLLNFISGYGFAFCCSPPYRGGDAGQSTDIPNIWLGPKRSKLEPGRGEFSQLNEVGWEKQCQAAIRARFVLCPLKRYGDVSDVMLALATGRIPVIVSDEYQLPCSDQLDWQQFSFHLGTSHADFLKLQDITEISDERYQQMVQAGQAAWQAHFSPASLRQQIFSALEKEHLPAPSPALSNAEGTQPETEEEFLKLFWAEVAQNYPPDNGKSVIIMGAGKLLPKLLQAVFHAGSTPAILGIADDNASLHGQTFCGLKVGPLSDYISKEPDAVVLATDTYEKEMTARVHGILGSEIDTIGLGSFISAKEIDFDNFQYCPSRDWELSQVSVDDCVFDNHYSGSGRLSARKLEGLTVCVGYGDILKWTLPHNMKHFDRFVVVTSSNDTDSQTIARDCGAELVISDSYKESGCAFNKGRMLNAGIEALDFDDWCLTIDSDIILNESTRDFIMSKVLNDSALYFTTRHNIPHDRREWWLECYLETGKSPCPPILTGEPEPYGFFQLFHSQAPVIRDSGNNVFSEAFNNAGGVDLQFSMRWVNAPDCFLAYIPLKTFHVPHGHWGANWSGRTSEKLTNTDVATPGSQADPHGWLQIAYHSASSLTLINDFPNSAGFLKYTRSDTGEYIIVPYSPEMAHNEESCIILGRKLNGVFTCGICSGCPGDITLAVCDGEEYSGWGVGRLKNSNVSYRCWNGRIMTSVSDFDISFKRQLSSFENTRIVPC